MNPGIQLLTERERECLRLLLRPMRAKGIAVQLGLSVYTINEHLRSARGKLGATDSLTAANLLREAEGPHPQSLVPSNSECPELRETVSDTAGEQKDHGGSRRSALSLPLATRGRPWNAMTLRQRMIWPVIIAFAAVLAAGVFLAGMAALSQVAIELTR